MLGRLTRTFARRPIPCFVLVYREIEIIRRSIHALACMADRLDIQVIENPSDASDSIRPLLDEYLASGIVKRCFFFEENITNNAFEIILGRELEFSRHHFVLATDGDLLPLQSEWLDEELFVLQRHSEVFCIGGTLDMANLPLRTFPDAGDWIPPDIADRREYIEALTGVWFLLFRANQLNAMLRRLAENNEHFRDGIIANYCYQQLGSRWARTRHSRFIHLTWDLYQDPDHPYTRFKRDVPFHVHWQHDRSSAYRTREFRRGRYYTSALRNH
jgi:hypothetical protein